MDDDGVSQADLSRTTGYTESAISDIVNGQVKLTSRSLPILSTALKRPQGDLLMDTFIANTQYGDIIAATGKGRTRQEGKVTNLKIEEKMQQEANHDLILEASMRIQTIVGNSWTRDFIKSVAKEIAIKCGGEITDHIVNHHIELVNRRQEKV